jgi:hypothetical protein
MKKEEMKVMTEHNKHMTGLVSIRDGEALRLRLEVKLP